jgi:hypothetical protein
VHSPRFRRRSEIGVDQHFAGCPEYQKSIADAGARHLRLWFRDRVLHRITAALWDKDEFLTAAEPWGEVVANGARILETELIDDTDDAFSAWQETYQMSREEVKFVRALFERKMSRPGGLIYLEGSHVKWLESMSERSEALKTCKESLEAIGIIFPETGR